MIIFFFSKRSSRTLKNVSQNCQYAFNFFCENYHEYESVLEIILDDFEDYFRHLEERTLRKVVKRKYRNNLKAFINYLLGRSRAYNESILHNYDYIFSDENVAFTDTSGAIERDALSIREELEILAFYKTRGLRDYVLVGLLTYSGCRVGGLCALKVDDIDF